MRKEFDSTLPLGDGAGEIPAELAAVDAALAELARVDARSGSPGLEDRLFMATRSAIGEGAEAAQISGGLEALAAQERAGAGVAFEERVFVATRAYLRRGAGEQTVAPRASVVVLRRWLSAAAAIAVIGASVAAWLWSGDGVQPPVAPGGDGGVVIAAGPTAEELAGRLDREMDMIVNVVWSPSASDGMQELSRDVEWLSGMVQSDWFQLGSLSEEESL